ncbi:hypothetical protein EG831_03670 [bacterium]|nr:hypothetical protein [bacterium]
MNSYVTWDKSDVTNLNQIGMETLYTEIDAAGIVLREIGFDKKGHVVHKYPSSSHKYGQYGLFDNQIVQVSNGRGLVTKSDFEREWDGA